MKIPVDRVDLGTLGYEGYWLEVPRSVKEGYLHEFAKTGPQSTADIADDTESARATNIKIMSLITAWNIDDDDGKVLPVIGKCKTVKEQERVIAELPVDLIVHVAQRIVQGVQVPEAVKDF